MAKGIPLMGRGPDGRAKMINVDENGNVKVQLSGNIFGADISDRPSANSVPVGTVFVIANATLDAWISNGTDWVVI
jgi:hypothetical protein